MTKHGCIIKDHINDGFLYIFRGENEVEHEVGKIFIEGEVERYAPERTFEGKRMATANTEVSNGYIVCKKKSAEASRILGYNILVKTNENEELKGEFIAIHPTFIVVKLDKSSNLSKVNISSINDIKLIFDNNEINIKGNKIKPALIKRYSRFCGELPEKWVGMVK